MSAFKKIMWKLRLTKEYLRVSLKNAMEFKIDFFAYFLGETIFIILSYFFALYFTKAIPNLGLTTIELFTYTQTIDIIVTIIWASNASVVSLIREGAINLYLIRPVNVLLQIFFDATDIKRVIFMIFKFLVLVIFCAIYMPINLFLYISIIILAIPISVLLAQGFFYLIRALDLKKLEMGQLLFNLANMNFLTTQIQKFPIYIFPKLLLAYVAIFPIYYLANIIVNIINAPNITYIILLLCAELIIAIIFLIAANKAWKKMLKYYDGVGG